MTSFANPFLSLSPAPSNRARRGPVSLAALLFVTATAFAQAPQVPQPPPAQQPPMPAAGLAAPPAPPAGGPGAAPDAAMPPPPAAGPRGKARLQQRDERPLADAGAATSTSTSTGRVARWLPNPNGDIDGLLLDDGTQVALPPMQSVRVLQSVRLGETVQITGTRGGDRGPGPVVGGPGAVSGSPDALANRGTSGRVLRATQIRNAAGATLALTDGEAGAAPAAPPTTPGAAPRGTPREAAALTPMNASGRIATLLYTGRGDVNGAVLDNGTVVRFPPHVGAAMAQELKAGGTLYARGYGTRNATGSAFEATRLGATEGSARDVFGPLARAGDGGPAQRAPVGAGPGAVPPAPPAPRVGQGQPVPPAPVAGDRAAPPAARTPASPPAASPPAPGADPAAAPVPPVAPATPR